jgi:hypothetical protein
MFDALKLMVVLFWLGCSWMYVRSTEMDKRFSVPAFLMILLSVFTVFLPPENLFMLFAAIGAAVLGLGLLAKNFTKSRCGKKRL